MRTGLEFLCDVSRDEWLHVMMRRSRDDGVHVADYGLLNEGAQDRFCMHHRRESRVQRVG
ncbi:hypothetical protein Lalb_Chr12g0206311 [Lupinus albus]|uniref:Uncharacterized protein n=1 Tax=Lupinus albus TaxID=3870 RepID=A0A6A4PNH2_LUPAL|nr:hypothetical protein Lalb_Chr12g0206311 [Lupinus albus]